MVEGGPLRRFRRINQYELPAALGRSLRYQNRLLFAIQFGVTDARTPCL
jgi:hypothetical protein